MKAWIIRQQARVARGKARKPGNRYAAISCWSNSRNRDLREALPGVGLTHFLGTDKTIDEEEAIELLDRNLTYLKHDTKAREERKAQCKEGCCDKVVIRAKCLAFLKGYFAERYGKDSPENPCNKRIEVDCE